MDVLRGDNQGVLAIDSCGGQGLGAEKHAPDNGWHKQGNVGSAPAHGDGHEQQNKNAKPEPWGQVVKDESQTRDVGYLLVESQERSKAEAQEDNRESCQNS
ncbi:hypothetical protein GCM10010038_33060 [Glutamicibacter protophormiae]|nr:hypothetical protein GCM10010038_33060 [Glutamicibacter protophormiae]